MENNKQTSFDKFRHWLKANLYIGVGKSLLIWFLAISFVPLATVSFINYIYAYLGLNAVAEKSIVTTSQLRVEYLNTFFKEVANFLEIQANLESNKEFLETLKKNYEKSNQDLKDFVNSNQWNQLTADQQADFKEILQKQGYYNLYYISDDGDILFSLKQENDLGTNIFKGKFSNTRFSKVCEEALDLGKIRFSDLEFYTPSNDLLSGFFAQSIKGKSGIPIGILAIQINMDRINKIIQDDVGLGETGEAYLVGPDLKMRSATRFDDESVILNNKAKTEKTLLWQIYIRNKEDLQYIKGQGLDKEEISIYQNPKGEYVLGIYRHLDYLEKMGVQWALIEEIEHAEAYAYARQLSDIAKISFIVTIVVVFFISILVTKKFVTPIKKLSAWAKQVAFGELSSKNVKAPKNEVGEMVDTFNSLVNSLQSYAKVSQSAAYGDYSKSVIIRSEKDILGKSMNRMVESFKNVVEQANQIAKGNYSTNIVPRSDKDTLGISLYKMTKKLRETSKEVRDQDWFKTGLSKLESKLSGLKDIKILTDEVITFLVEYLDSQLGLIYIADNNVLKLTSSYALKDRKREFTEFKFGEGLIGQSAKEKQILKLTLPKEKVPSLNFGIGEQKPFHSVIAPFIFESEVKGIIQLGSFYEYTDLQLSYIEKCLDNIAIAVNTVQVHTRVEKLLEQTQKQASELQTQQEELRQANEELEEQTKALKLSEENLKNQQEELRVINEELEERTNDLEIERDNIRKKNEELKKAQEEIKQKAKDVEAASKYKSEFLANMSHELRTPLNSIIVLSQLLAENRKRHLDRKETEFAKTINSSGSDLLDLINEILDLSKVESGKIDLNIEDVYIREIIDYVIKTFKPLTDKKKLELEINIQKNTPGKIRTDSQRLFQIIKNLVSNAIKFTKEGSITLNVFKPDKKIDLSDTKLKHDSSLALSVIDTGIGIPKTKLKAIFEAFQQADGTTNRKYGGTGLGLTISRNFANLLGGKILVDSKENKGSEFTLIIPQNYEKPDNKITEPHNKQKDKTVQSKTSKYEPKITKDKYSEFTDDKNNIEEGDNIILVIEDDINFCHVLYELSHEKGFKCLIALDGETGLHYADYYLPDAIILDIGLPGIDGYEVMKRLKEKSKTRHIPIHIISALDKTLDAMKMGAIGFLTKPVSNEKLEDVFKNIENIISMPIRKALIVEDEPLMRKSIVDLLDEGNVEITAVESGEEAFELIKKERFECMILDLGLKDLSGFDLLEKIRKNEKISDLPVIIYTGQDLSKEENEKLQKYADSIILKGARSFERLLNEATLFLHQIQEDMPTDKQKILKAFQSKDDVLMNKKILIVDDDMRNVFALSSVLEENGAKVIVGKNGKEGIDKLENNPDTNLILMDIMMPEMDGYEAMMQIRKKKKYKNLPIIALTAKAMKGDRAKCIAAGANDYVAKPVNTDKLLSLLRVWLYNK